MQILVIIILGVSAMIANTVSKNAQDKRADPVKYAKSVKAEQADRIRRFEMEVAR